MDPTLTTARLRFRSWHDADLPLFAALNADPIVMEHFPRTLDRPHSDAMVARIRSHFAEHGYGLWAVETIGGAHLIGFVGLAIPGFTAPFTPCTEIGWRLASRHWARDCATEAAVAAADFAFDRLKLSELVSFTTTGNLRSRRVMERLGMTHDSAYDFDHPNVPAGHPLRPHVLYRLRQTDWRRPA